MAEDIDRAKDLALSKAAKYISSCLTVLFLLLFKLLADLFTR